MKYFTSLLFILLFFSTSYAGTITFDYLQQPKTLTSLPVTLPSGTLVDGANGVICENGCEDIVEEKSKKKIFLFAAAGLVAGIWLSNDCCCDNTTLISSPPPTILIPPATSTPAPPVSEVPEPSYFLLILLILLYATYRHTKRFNFSIRSSQT